MPQALRGREVDSRPGRGRQQTDRQLGSGPAQFDCVEAVSGQPCGVVVQSRHALIPGGERVGLVEAQHVLKLAPELLIRLVRRQIGMDERRPRRMRRRDEAPVGRALADDLECLLHARQHVLAE